MSARTPSCDRHPTGADLVVRERDRSGLVAGLREIGPPALLVVVLAYKLVQMSALDHHRYPAERWVATATLGGLLVLVSPLAILPCVSRYIAILGLNAALTALALGDVIHQRFYGDVLSIQEIGAVGQLGRVAESVTTLLKPTDALYFLDVVVGAALVPIYARMCRGRPPALPRAHAAAGLLVAGLFLVLPSVRMAWLDPEEVFGYAAQRRDVVAAVGLLPYHAYDLAIHL